MVGHGGYSTLGLDMVAIVLYGWAWWLQYFTVGHGGYSTLRLGMVAIVLYGWTWWL